MTFSELTRLMLHSMDFFELRRTAARYEVPYQGVRRNKLVRELEKKIILKNAQLDDDSKGLSTKQMPSPKAASNLSKVAKYKKQIKPVISTKINTFSSLDSQSRVYNIENN